MEQDPTFYLLKPFNFIPEDEPKQWIGRIVKAYQDPASNFTPNTPDPTPSTPGAANLNPSASAGANPIFAPSIYDDPDFSNVETLIKSSHSKSASVLLADMLKLSQSSSDSSAPEFKARQVRRLKLRQEDICLEHQLALPEVKSQLKEWHGIRRPVYFIVGLLSTNHIRYSERTKQQSSRAMEAKPPTKAMAAAAGAPPGVVPDVAKIEVSKSEDAGMDSTLTVSGSHIFAFEFRVLRKRILSTSGVVDMRPGGVRGDRTFAHEDETGASGMEEQQTEVVMDEDPLPEVDEEAGDRCFMIHE